ncbi:MAG TPA: oligosaccharide flippase family protein [Baekduia sp.]|nr:oligosaccharide flippase family protein [Baekduia sp.]
MQDASPEPLDAARAGEKALRGGALRSGGYAATVLLSLISAPLVIRHLGVEEFGVFVTITALVTVASGVSDLGLTSIGTREWAQRPAGDRRGLLADLLGARLVLTTLALTGAFAFGLAAGYDGERMAGVAVAGAGLVVLAVQQSLTVPLAARLQQGRIAAADVVRQAVQVVCIVGFVLAGAGLVPLLATAIPAALVAALVTAAGARDALVAPALHVRRWWAMLRDALPFAAASALSVVYLRATVLLTSLVATEAATGEFSIAFRVLEVLINVPALVVGALFPLLARAAVTDAERLRTALGRTWAGAVAVGGVAAVGVAAGAPLAVLALAGERPDGAVDALRILAAGLGLSFVGAACQYGLLAARHHREILLINAAALTLNVVLTLLLADAHGAVGAAIALTACELLIAVLSSVLLVRRTAMTLPLAHALRVAGAIAVGAAVAVAAATLGIVAEALLAPAACLAAALALRAVPHELLALARRSPA